MTGVRAAAALGVCTVLLAGCSAPKPVTPTEYRDDLNPQLALRLESDGSATVTSFPAPEAGECIENNGWDESVLRDGSATWSLVEGNQIEVAGDGWVVDLAYVWRHASPDFTELRYPTCTDGDRDQYFIIRNY